MDSLTQLVLGAAVAEAPAGRQVGRRAMAWGALCGTLPDLDVLVPLGGAVADFTFHRSFSHSLLLLALATPLLVWLILKLHPDTRAHRARWLALVYLVFASHVLLDSFTVYGTQIFWPIDPTPMTWSTIFIIDPLYTLPLLVGVLAALLARGPRARGRRTNALALAFSSLYLAWSLGAKLHVEDRAQESLAAQGIRPGALLVTPSPFNTVLWRILAMTEDAYYEGFYSLLDGAGPIALQRHPRGEALLQGLEGHWPVRRLRWFTKGFYAVAERDGRIVISDLRMGLEPDYVFRFAVAELGNPHARPIADLRVHDARDWSRLGWLWRRIRGAEPPAQAGSSTLRGSSEARAAAGR